MKEAVSILLRVAVISLLVLAGFWLYKHSTRAAIELGDQSMDKVSFPEGGYSVNTSITSISGLKSGDVVAYRVPRADPPVTRIARVIGVEGNKVEVTPKDVLVNGKSFGRKFELAPSWVVPELKVPRGCVYLLADNPFIGVDSKQLGPVPFSFVIGTVKPVN